MLTQRRNQFEIGGDRGPGKVARGDTGDSHKDAGAENEWQFRNYILVSREAQQNIYHEVTREAFVPTLIETYREINVLMDIDQNNRTPMTPDIG